MVALIRISKDHWWNFFHCLCNICPIYIFYHLHLQNTLYIYILYILWCTDVQKVLFFHWIPYYLFVNTFFILLFVVLLVSLLLLFFGLLSCSTDFRSGVCLIHTYNFYFIWIFVDIYKFVFQFLGFHIFALSRSLQKYPHNIS